MSRVRFGGAWAAVFVFWAAGAGSAFAQYRPPANFPGPVTPPPITVQGPTGPPPGSMPDFDPDYMRHNQEAWDRNVKPLQTDPGLPPINQAVNDWLSPSQLTTYLEIVLAVGVTVLMFWAGLQIYTRCARPSDPMKAALNDPWVQAHLARQGMTPDQPQREPPA